MTAAETLDRAKALVTGDRRAAYGPAVENFSAGAQIIEALLRRRGLLKPDAILTALDYALIMASVKLDRIAGKYSEDSVVDLVGYVALMTELEEE